jgi:hypothetical protein
MIFQNIKPGDDIRKIVKSAFDLELDISGEWGYDQENALKIHSFEGELFQFEHALASMRAYIEMNMTVDETKRYGAINVNEIKREVIRENNKVYDKITYEISAMPEKMYEAFIAEYKEKYESPDFDIQEHFEKRKKATIVLQKVFWFEISDTIQLTK